MDESTTILLAVDGSAAALAAVRHALGLTALPGGARGVLVNVQEHASLYEVVITQDAERITEIKRDAGAGLLREAEAMLQAAGLDCECEVAAGTPEHLIVELA